MTDPLLDRYEGLTFRDQVVIDRVCSRYEAALRAGEDPSLEEYVRGADVGDCACLLTELVALDRACRSGGSLSRDDYVARFPDLAGAIDEAFRPLSSTYLGPPPRSPLPATSPPPAFDGYEVLGELGRGGMGVVYRARHLRLKRLVALKVILQGDYASEQMRARFLVEAEMLGRLRHPNVVQVFEAGQQSGRPFLALEYVEGGTLSQRLAAGGPLAPREAAALVGQLARAVHCAHLQGVVHRDIKPANVLMSADGTPKITDFGLARQLDQAGQTMSGVVVGTPGYMPPEQARGERQTLGPGADVYSLGAVLYEALTGQAPFRAATPLETLDRVLNDEPTPPARLRPGLDPDLGTICLKCLRKEPGGRYAAADALADDLDRWLAGEPVAARPAGAAERAWKWARRKPTQAGLLAVSALLLLAVVGIPTGAAVRLRREQERTRQADEQRRLALVQSLHAAAPEGVPFLVEELAPAPEQVLPLLREQFDAPDTRFRAAVALTLLGDDRTEYLLAAIPTAPPAESANLARAFRASSDPGVADELDRRGREAEGVPLQVRYAILLLDLGDARLARSLLTGPAPNPRSTFLEEVRTWHGTLAAWPAFVDAADEDLRAALCAAVGRVDRTRLDPDVRRALVAALSRQFRDAPGGGIHAASEWSLRQWEVPLPALEEGAAGHRWFVNRAGMTMMGIPPGVVRRYQREPAVLPRTYYVADREVTLGQFRRFLAEAAERPADWKANPDLDIRPDHPLHGVQPAHVTLFCNWLSAREGRRRCYRPDGKQPGGWVCDFTADGYRLPTSAEWLHAHNAGAATRFCFGEDARWLSLYGQVALQVTAPCGSKLPNRWGLFDVVGNVWEVTGDAASFADDGAAQRPYRGGGFNSGSFDCLAHQGFVGSWNQGGAVGFRVVCGSATPTPEALPAPGDRRAALDYLGRAAVEDPNLFLLRGDLHGRYADWPAAAKDFGQAVRRSPPDAELWLNYAPLLLQTGDGAGYRALRRRLLDRYGETKEARVAECIAKACLLGEGEGDDLDRVLRLLEATQGEGAPPWLQPYAELVRGMAEYRRGDYAAAADWLGRCRPGGGRWKLSDESEALRGFFLAMALGRSGRHDEAAGAFEQARALRDRLAASQAARPESAFWKDVLRATIAEAEAREVLKSSPR